MEPIAPSGNHSFQWKPYTLVEAVRFSVNCFLSFQCKPFRQRKSLVFSFRKAFVFGEIYCRQLKPIFLEEAYSFQQKHGGSCFCFNIFTSRSYQKLPEYLNINIWTEQQQFYKAELLYLYLLKIYKNFQYLPLIYCQNPKWSWKSIYFGRAFPHGCFQHLSFKALK